MPQYAANVSMLFTDVPFLARFDAAARAGFQAVEFMWPSPEQLGGVSIGKFGAMLKATKLTVALFNFSAGDMSLGYRGLAGLPEEAAAFRANVPVAIGLAVELGCRKLNALAGNAGNQDTRPAHLSCLTDNLRYASDHAAGAGINVMLEALNPSDFPTYLIQNSGSALDLIGRVDRPNVKFQLDVYHLAMAGEDPLDVVRRSAGHIGHVQFADSPGRHEPGTGAVRWPQLIQSLEQHGYRDWIGLEYNPTDPSIHDFAYLPAIGGVLVPRA